MKSIILSLCLLLSLGANAANDYVQFEGEWGEEFVYIPGLAEDLFQVYTIQSSRGPSWGQDFWTIADSLGDIDVHESMSYWNEDGWPTDSCPDFTDEDFESIDEYGQSLRWESVKRKEGSKRTVYYLVYIQMELYANGKSCTYDFFGDEAFVFQNASRSSAGDQQYLGQLSWDPPQN